MNQDLRYTCPKCGGRQYEIGEMWTIGSIWTRMFEFHNRRFVFITCQRCRFTELFKTSRKNIAEVYNNLARK